MLKNIILIILITTNRITNEPNHVQLSRWWLIFTNIINKMKIMTQKWVDLCMFKIIILPSEIYERNSKIYQNVDELSNGFKKVKL